MVIGQPYMSEALGSSFNHGAKSVGGVFVIWGAYEAEILVLGGGMAPFFTILSKYKMSL